MNKKMENKNFKDLSGLRFGRLTVVGRAENNPGGQARWICHCDCGNEAIPSGSNLRRGQATSCGCGRAWKASNGKSVSTIRLEGVRFGMLVVIRQSDKKIGRDLVWECTCDCGSVVNATKTALEQYRKSCGCNGKPDLIGRKFGRLTVVSKINSRGTFKWRCVCECGNERILTIKRPCLENGSIKSCGCLKHKRNGLSRTPEYQAWNSMIYRCRDTGKNSRRYKDRGIAICDSWRESFENFLSDMGPIPVSGMSIDRIDNDSGYSKENCRWATAEQQAQNRSTNRLISFSGKTQCVSVWAKETGIGQATILRRINAGYSPEAALAPVRSKK